MHCSGQESAGIVTGSGAPTSGPQSEDASETNEFSVARFTEHRGMGLVGQVFPKETLRELKGRIGLGM